MFEPVWTTASTSRYTSILMHIITPDLAVDTEYPPRLPLLRLLAILSPNRILTLLTNPLATRVACVDRPPRVQPHPSLVQIVTVLVGQERRQALHLRHPPCGIHRFLDGVCFFSFSSTINLQRYPLTVDFVHSSQTGINFAVSYSHCPICTCLPAHICMG